MWDDFISKFNFNVLNVIKQDPAKTGYSNFETYRDQLKEIGDWIIFPRTLEYIADGRFAQDDEGRLYFDNERIPNGLRIERSFRASRWKNPDGF